MGIKIVFVNILFFMYFRLIEFIHYNLFMIYLQTNVLSDPQKIFYAVKTRKLWDKKTTFRLKLSL